MPGSTIKKNLYFPESMLEEMKREAARLDRSLSWVLIQSWRLAREGVRAFPSYPLYGDGPHAQEDDEAPHHHGDDGDTRRAA